MMRRSWCVLTLAAVLAVALGGVGRLAAQEVSIGGFIPFVGIGFSAEFKTIDALDLGGIPFIADPAFAPNRNVLLGGGSDPFFDIALLDTGAAVHILTQEAFAGFDLQGAGLRGANTQLVGGATGTLITEINDAAGIYAAGLGRRTDQGQALDFNASDLRGQTSIATLTAPDEWSLPNILGLPMAAQHGIAIRNSNPQVFRHQGRTIRTPEVEFIDLGSGADEGIVRRAPLVLNPGIGFIQGPQYVFNLDTGDILGGGGISIHDNPASPSVVQDSNGNGGGLFLEIDLKNDGREMQDQQLLFDTGADLTVVSQIMAKRLGFDPVLDTPDFVLEVEGSGGVQGGVPGFFVDELNIDTVGGDFTLQNVPIAVLDVTNPNDPGNIIDGIVGMHLFNGRDLVIDAEASFGQGGNGPSLYISDPVTNRRTWRETGDGEWTSAGNWQEGSAPNNLSYVLVTPDLTPPVQPPLTNAVIDSDVDAFRVTVRGAGGVGIDVSIDQGASLTVFGETLVEAGGRITLEGGRLDAQFVNLRGGVLAGVGELVLGTGIINGGVRNLGGTVAPGDGADTGTLSIDGDYSGQAGATLEIDLGGGLADLLEVTRFAFLSGGLEVIQTGALSVGDLFTILTAEEGVVGEFDALSLPVGFLWDVNYSANSVVLEVIGLGLEGDFSGDGVVDAADYTVWRDGLGTVYTIADYHTWRDNYGARLPPSAAASVPEPAALLLLAGVLPLAAPRRHR